MVRIPRLSKICLFTVLLLASLIASNSAVYGVQQDSNVIINPSLEFQLQGWGTWMKHGTATSTISVDNTRSVSGSYSARLDMGQTPIGFVALYQNFPTNVTFGELSDRPDSVDLWFYLEPKFDGMGDLQIKFIATTAHEVAYVFDPDPRLIYTNQTFRTDISLYDYPGGVWHHFSRNLRTDWQASVTLETGSTRPGFPLSEKLYRIEIDAIGFQDAGDYAHYSETAWVDDVRVYMNLSPNLPPTAEFTVTPSAPLLGRNVTFDASSSSDPDGTVSNYNWSFGDGTFASGRSSYHVFNSAGKFNVALSVIDDRGSETTTSRSIQVSSTNNPPNPTFSFTPWNPAIGETITFDARNSTDPDPGDSILSYFWDFGDGTFGSGSIVPHNYTTPALYDVGLTVMDSRQTTNTTQQSIFVTRIPYVPGVEPGQWARYTVSGNVPLASNLLLLTQNFTRVAGTKVNFTGTYEYFNSSRTLALSQDILSFRVIGLTAANLTTGDLPWANSQYTINSTLSETVIGSIRQVTVIRAPFLGGVLSGKWDQATGLLIELDENYPDSSTGTTKRLTVELVDTNIWIPSTNRPPVPVFTWSPFSPGTGIMVSFDASRSYDADVSDAVVRYRWNFGDGTTIDSASATVSHTYSAKGSYNVSLVVFDNDTSNALSYRSITVLVHDVGITQVLVTPYTSIIGQPFSIQVTLSNTGDVDENVTATVTSGASLLASPQNVSVSAGTTRILQFTWDTAGSEPGPHTILASVSVVPGETDTSDNSREGQTVKLLLPLAVTITRSPETGRVPVVITFSAEVTGGSAPYTVSWSFGDGSSGYGNPIEHGYQSQGHYVTTAIVTDALGDTASSSVATRVDAPDGSLRIRVQDSSGNPIPGASIFITRVPTGQAVPSVASTLPNGTASFSNILPGTYEFTVLADGYQVKNQAANVTAGPQNTETIVVLATAQRSNNSNYPFYLGLATAVIVAFVAVFILRRRRSG